MAQVTIRNLDDAVLQALKRRAAVLGHSTEEEARRALAMAVGIDRGIARGRLDAVRERLSRSQDGTAEDLVRTFRDSRADQLSG